MNSVLRRFQAHAPPTSFATPAKLSAGSASATGRRCDWRCIGIKKTTWAGSGTGPHQRGGGFKWTRTLISTTR